MNDILRIYDPIECDEQGVPLDWESCRECGGDGGLTAYATDGGCPTCGGHGSLKAAALAYLLNERGREDHETDVQVVYREHGSLAQAVCSCGWASKVMDDADVRDAAWTHREHDPHPAHGIARCEGCGHPMNDGTWVNAGSDDGDPLLDEESIRTLLNQSYGTFARWANRRGAAYWSPCDEGCHHDGPRRADVGLEETEWVYQEADGSDIKFVAGPAIDASWRAVDVRAMGWPHDLRPEKLKILCLRCWSIPQVGTRPQP